MRIAVNTRFLIKDRLEGFGHYTHALMSRIVKMHPQDAFEFYFDRPFAQEYIYSDKVNGKALFPPARHPLLFYLWNQFALRRAIHTSQSDVFFSPDSFMPLGLKCPSVITVHDVAHQRYPEAISWAHRKYYEHFMPKFLQEADAVITVSDFSRQEILYYYDIPPEKITVVYNGIGEEYRPLSAEEQHAVRHQFTQGYPYFLFVGAIHPRKNVARLIEAFTQFRKESATHLKLLIAGRKSWDYADVDQAISSSPYKDDIVFAGYIPVSTLARITASAHALCYISLYEGFGLPVAEAMACAVPVIVSKESAQSEVAGDAGFAIDPLSLESIVQGMIQITQDTQLRTQLVRAGAQRSLLFSWDVAAKQTYSILEGTAKH